MNIQIIEPSGERQQQEIKKGDTLTITDANKLAVMRLVNEGDTLTVVLYNQNVQPNSIYYGDDKNG